MRIYGFSILLVLVAYWFLWIAAFNHNISDQALLGLSMGLLAGVAVVVVYLKERAR